MLHFAKGRGSYLSGKGSKSSTPKIHLINCINVIGLLSGEATLYTSFPS